jgi:hypothetical protein
MIKFFIRCFHQSIGTSNFSVFIILIFCICQGCQNENEIIITNSKLVVEGFIEENSVANVILSKSIPVNSNFNEKDIDKYFVRAAKVTVSDGKNSEILSLKMVEGYVPPFIYVGEKIIGKEGNSYFLTVEYLNEKLIAQTTIPETVSIGQIKIDKIDGIRGKLNLKFTDPLSKNYYQIATKIIGKDSLFIPALYGNLDDITFFSQEVDINVLKGIKFYPEKETDVYFPLEKVIEVKLRTMDKISYDFWNSWQNDVLNGQNPLFPNSFNLKSNIKGGYGIWTGYGSEIRAVKG